MNKIISNAKYLRPAQNVNIYLRARLQKLYETITNLKAESVIFGRLRRFDEPHKLSLLLRRWLTGDTRKIFVSNIRPSRRVSLGARLN